MKLRKNDTIIVIAGKHKGKTGKITKVFTDQDRVTIAGVNIVKKHVKPSQTNPDGGIQEKEAPIHVSNVAYYLKGKGNGPQKLGFKYESSKDGKRRTKHRIIKKTGKAI